MKRIILLVSVTILLIGCNSKPNPLYYDEGIEIGGIIWATRNADINNTFAATPADAGAYFQWNNAKGWSASDDLYNFDFGYYSNAMVWDESNNPCPKGWRVPNKNELNKLYEGKSIWREASPNNWERDGIWFGENCEKATSENNNSCIFLPAVGAIHRAEYTGLPFIEYTLKDIGLTGSYWGATFSGRPPIFNNNTYDIMYISAGYFNKMLLTSTANIGHSVRCVKIK